ncbi:MULTISPECIES: hypothetical protein [unclassified Streptomyces]|uniref:hypothetical protein n=1 Tax=unclassified Streptomyces TaxID=2593676 RepID=UPI00380B6A7F
MSHVLDRPEPRQVPPREHPWWNRALALLNRDLAATLPQQGPLRLLAHPGHGTEYFYVAMADGEWHGNYLLPDTADDPEAALAAVADAAQETVTECLSRAWPVCAAHDRGMHPRDADGHLSWWCAGERPGGGSAHVVAAVGVLDTVADRG